MTSIKPFRFRLAKVSSEYIHMVNDLLQFLPAKGDKEKIQLAVRKALQQYLSDIRYYLKDVEKQTFHDFFTRLPNPCCLGVLGLEPFSEKAFVELDPVLSLLVIEKLLGGAEQEFGSLRPLTETEQGVIEFLLLKLLSQIHKLCGSNAKLHFRLEKMILEPSHVRPFEREGKDLVCLKFHVSFLKRSGFIKIYLPNPWILEGFLKDLPEDQKSLEHLELKKDLSRFDDFNCFLSGVLGRAQVVAKDLKDLEEGDVVLFDETGLKFSNRRWSGKVVVGAGKGLGGGFVADWEGFQEKGKVKLVDTLKGGKVHV